MANGATANAPMSVAVTAIFINVGLLFVALNMKQMSTATRVGQWLRLG